MSEARLITTDVEQSVSAQAGCFNFLLPHCADETQPSRTAVGLSHVVFPLLSFLRSNQHCFFVMYPFWQIFYRSYVGIPAAFSFAVPCIIHQYARALR